MTQEQSLITAEMRATFGVEGPATVREVDRTSIRMFARSVGYTNQVFYDVAEAKSQGYRDLPAPPGYLGTPVFKPGAGGEDGMPRARPGGLTRGLNGGTEYEYLDDIVAGDILESRSQTLDMVERKGAMGPMIITRTETNYRRQSDGKVVAKGTGTGISY